MTAPIYPRLLIRGGIQGQDTRVYVLGPPDENGNQPEAEISMFVTRVDWTAKVGEPSTAHLHCLFPKGEMPACLDELVADFYVKPNRWLWRLKVALERLTWRGRILRRTYRHRDVTTLADRTRRFLP